MQELNNLTITYDSLICLDQTVEKSIDKIELLNQSIECYNKLRIYIRRRKKKAYKRSVRNQQNPIHTKKCKHGRQQRTKKKL